MITGIDRIVYGVTDLTQCARFFRDWGLRPMAGDRPCFATLDGGEVELRAADDAGLPAAIEPGPTLRRLVWGVDSEASLAALRDRLADHGTVSEDEDGPGLADPNGLRLSFRVSRRRAVEAAGADMNTAARHPRVDRRAPIYDRAEPVSIGHVVLFSPDVMAAVGDFAEPFAGPPAREKVTP